MAVLVTSVHLINVMQRWDLYGLTDTTPSRNQPIQQEHNTGPFCAPGCRGKTAPNHSTSTERMMMTIGEQYHGNSLTFKGIFSSYRFSLFPGGSTVVRASVRPISGCNFVKYVGNSKCGF